jgi:hypothetical protein
VLAAFEAAGDPAQFPEQLDSLEVWQPKNLYLHLYPERSFTHSWTMQLDELGGKSPVEMCRYDSS